MQILFAEHNSLTCQNKRRKKQTTYETFPIIGVYKLWSIVGEKSAIKKRFKYKSEVRKSRFRTPRQVINMLPVKRYVQKSSGFYLLIPFRMESLSGRFEFLSFIAAQKSLQFRNFICSC